MRGQRDIIIAPMENSETLVDWITVQEASKLSGYHPERVRELVRDGKVSARKFGFVWMVSKSSLEKYTAAAKKSSDKRRGPK